MTAASDRSSDTKLRKAASLLICRDGEKGLEVLVLKRSSAMRFLPGFLSFPGGSLDATDAPLRSCWSHPVTGNEQADDADYAAGALRETSEETGLLPAVCDSQGQTQTVFLDKTRQQALLEGTSTFVELLEALRLQIDGRNLRFVGRWITPPFMPKRFDTRFFITVAAGAADELRVNPDENEWAAWYRPSDILGRVLAKEEKAAPPTQAMLRAMAEFDTTADCFAALYVPGPDPNDPSLRSVLRDL